MTFTLIAHIIIVQVFIELKINGRRITGTRVFHDSSHDVG